MDQNDTGNISNPLKVRCGVRCEDHMQEHIDGNRPGGPCEGKHGDAGFAYCTKYQWILTKHDGDHECHLGHTWQ